MKEKDNLFLGLTASVAALGGLLFGFDTAVISGTTPFIQPYFALNDIELGWTVSSLLVGCIIGVMSSGKPGDLLGRRNTLIAAALMFAMSAIGSALSTHIGFFILFRFIGGLAVGTASMLSPMYISEISPAKNRGTLVSLNQMAIVIGILLAFFSNYLIAGTGINCWRWMLAVMSLPAILFFITLIFVPESPRWLIQKGRVEEAYSILKRINGVETATLELSAIEQSISSENHENYPKLFSKELRPILGIGILIAIFSQVTGINAIMYYAPLIFKNIGNGTESALIQTAFIGGINFLFTLVAIFTIDKWGRKPLLITGSIGMIISLTVITIAYFLNKLDGYLILFFIFTFIASYAASLGPVSWVVISEIFPNKMRSKAMSLTIVGLWTSNFLVTLTFPAILNRLGGGVAFLFFDVMCVLLLVFIVFKVPETKGRSLEELEIILLKKKS
jgi:SP family arabinose:H+ symporter-like MFS transporter